MDAVQRSTSLGKREAETCDVLSPESLKADLAAWLQAVLKRKDWAKVHLKDIEAADLFECANAEEISILLGIRTKAAVVVAEKLAELRAGKRMKSIKQEPMQDDENLNPNPLFQEEPQVDRKPDLRKLKQEADALPDEEMHDQEQVPAQEARRASERVAKLEPAQAQAQEFDEDMLSDEESEEEHVDDEDADYEANYDEETDDEMPNQGPPREYEQRTTFRPVEAVELPSTKVAVKRYAEKAITGFASFLDDMPAVAVRSIAAAYGVKLDDKNGKRRKKSKKKVESEIDRQQGSIWCVITEDLEKAFADQDDWQSRVAKVLDNMKKFLHDALMKPNVQHKRGTYTALHKRIPLQFDIVLNEAPYTVYDREEWAEEMDRLEREETEKMDEKNRKLPKNWRRKKEDEYHKIAVLDEDTIERLWQVWQCATHYLCTIKAPMLVTAPKLQYLLASGSRGSLANAKVMSTWNGKLLNYALHGKLRDESHRMQWQAPTHGEKAIDAYAVEQILPLLVKSRHESQAQEGAVLPLVYFEPDESLDVAGQNKQGYTLTCKLFLEGALASMDPEDGCSGFASFTENHTMVQMVELMRYSNEFREAGLELKQRCDKFAVRHKEVASSVMDIAVAKGLQDNNLVAKAVDGSVFKDLLQLLSDTQQHTPEDLAEQLVPLLTVTPTNYQLASLHFVQNEEASEEGLQRHCFWPITLPHDPDMTCYLVPHLNSLWWASDKSLLLPEKREDGSYEPSFCPIRKPRSISYSGTPAKGGMLALEMGMGKTLVMIMAHVLQQHTLPEEAICHTQYSDEELKQFENVLYGKDEETAKEVPMYTGFKQLDDDKGTVVPDGSIRFTGLGNLVVAPPTLAPQWEKEIQNLTTQPQKIVILDTLAQRRHYMTSMAGLKELAEYDWVITTPAKVPRDIDMLKAIDWRRVIADEGHSLRARCGPSKGLTPVERDVQLMALMADIPASEGHWVLTGTPLRNYKQVASMDRIFRFLGTGISTMDLHNATFVMFMHDIAIRYSKDGNFQGEKCLKLPPVYEEIRLVNLSEADTLMLGMVQSKLVQESIGAEQVLQQQSLFHKRQQGDMVDEDEEEEEVRQGDKANNSGIAMKVLSKIVDPLRRCLSCAQDLYLKNGTADDPNGIDVSVEGLHIGWPQEVTAMKPRRRKGEDPPDYKAIRKAQHEKLARDYTEFNLTSKMDVVIEDVEKILEEGTGDETRPPKIIVYSNFPGAFTRLQASLNDKGIAYASLITSMSMKKRAAAMEEFRESENVPIFLLNKALGATGINLTVATHVLILEPSWNPVFEEQAISRAHRMGQRGPINVVRYVANDTIDKFLRDMMMKAASQDDGVEEKLMEAVEQKGTFDSDDKALNQTIAKTMDLPALCMLIGELEDDDEAQADAPNTDDSEAEN